MAGNGNGLSPWAYGDPETTGAAQASMAMEPAVTDYLHKMSTGQIAASGLRALDVPYDPNQSFAANALNPQRLQAAQDIAMGFSGGGLQFEAFHGTPATPYSRFADEFMGSGEGAQSYSWGHYVAQAPGTAKAYMPSEMQLTLDDKPWEYSSDIDDYHKNMALDWMRNSNGDLGNVVMNLHQEADMIEEDLNNPHQFGMNTSDDKQRMEDYRHAASFLLDNQGKITSSQLSGNLATVNVIPEHEEFLDWEQKFHAQEPGVQENVENMKTGGDWAKYLASNNPTGQQLYDKLVDDNIQGADYRIPYGQARMQASKQLDAAGVPGMRFLDQGSRGLQIAPLTGPGKDDIAYQVIKTNPFSTSGEGRVLSTHSTYPEAKAQLRSMQSHNYVVYNPDNIEITHWNGVPVSAVEGTPPGLPDVSGAEGP